MAFEEGGVMIQDGSQAAITKQSMWVHPVRNRLEVSADREGLEEKEAF